MVGSTNGTPAVNDGCRYVALRYSTANSDTSFVCASGNGSLDQTYSPSSTIAANALVKIEFVDNGASWDVKLNGSSVCTMNTRLPASGTAMRWVGMAQTLANAADQFNFYHFMGKQ